jgi:hypothetical protein
VFKLLIDFFHLLNKEKTEKREEEGERLYLVLTEKVAKVHTQQS